MNDLRKVEVLKYGEWVEIDFKDLHCFDIFRMFEPTGEPVTDENGFTVFIADSEPFVLDGVYAIKIFQ
jgi:hypothetical protein